MIRVKLTQEILDEFKMEEKVFHFVMDDFYYGHISEGILLEEGVWKYGREFKLAIFKGIGCEYDKEFTAFLKEFYPETFL